MKSLVLGAPAVLVVVLTMLQQQLVDPLKAPTPLSAIAYGQEKAKPKQGQSTEKALVAQAKIIADLSQRVQGVEQRIQSLELREQQRSSPDSSRASRVDLTQVKLDLAGFESYCAREQDRALVYEKTTGHNVEAGAAMNCTQKLKTIVQELVGILDKQE